MQEPTDTRKQDLSCTDATAPSMDEAWLAGWPGGDIKGPRCSPSQGKQTPVGHLKGDALPSLMKFCSFLWNIAGGIAVYRLHVAIRSNTPLSPSFWSPPSTP